MERACLDDLSICLLSNDPDQSMKKLGANRLGLIDRALDIMNERIECGLKSEDLLRSTMQVDDRILRRVFKQAFGMGPMAMYRLLRLNRLRHELKSARGGDQTVAALAQRYGFKPAGRIGCRISNPIWRVAVRNTGCTRSPWNPEGYTTRTRNI